MHDYCDTHKTSGLISEQIFVLIIDNDGGTAASLHTTESDAMLSLIDYCLEFIPEFNLEASTVNDQQAYIGDAMGYHNQWFVLQRCTNPHAQKPSS